MKANGPGSTTESSSSRLPLVLYFRFVVLFVLLYFCFGVLFVLLYFCFGVLFLVFFVFLYFLFSCIFVAFFREKQFGRIGYVPYGGNGNSRNVSCSKPSLHCRKRPWEGALYKWLTRSASDAMHMALYKWTIVYIYIFICHRITYTDIKHLGSVSRKLSILSLKYCCIISPVFS